jgi:hypothetical protein
MPVIMKILEYLNESILKNILGLFVITGILEADSIQLCRISPVKKLLISSVAVKTSFYYLLYIAQGMWMRI